VWVPLDGADPIIVSVPLLTHDWVELPDGTICATVYDKREVDGTAWIGDKLVELTREDGVVRDVWNAWDAIPVEPALWGDLTDHTWTHANALDYDPVADTYLLGLRNYSSILVLDRATGALVDAISGPL